MKTVVGRRVMYGVFCLVMFLSCAGVKKTLPEAQPPARADPGLRVSFSSVGAWDIDHVNLELRVLINNPRAQEAQAEVVDWRLRLNGVEVTEGVDFFTVDWKTIQPKQTTALQAQLELDVKNLVPRALSRSGAGNFAEYQAQCSLDVAVRYGSGGAVTLRAQTETVFPRVLEPTLSIVSVAVNRAELINTRVTIKLRAQNPNRFPLELASLRYELYGGGRFWADGAENLKLSVPAHGAGEKDITLAANFIDMPRNFLDDIIALKQVRYRLSGEAQVNTSLPFLPSFTMRFNQNGSSRVSE